VKRIILPVVIAVLVALTFPIAFVFASAERDSDEDKILVTQGYLRIFRQELKQEILNQLAAEEDISVDPLCQEISVTEGKVLILSPNCEIIYRGGGAVALTFSKGKNEGIADMSAEKEIFSGEALQYGHVYYASSSSHQQSILITGSLAYFTVRGDYEIV